MKVLFHCFILYEFHRSAKAGMKTLHDIFDKTSFLKGYDIVDILLVSVSQFFVNKAI